MSESIAVVQSNPFGIRPTGKDAMAVSEGTIQREIAEVQAAVIMAKKFPRDPIAAMDRILQACARPTLAEDAQYQYAKGGQDIQGPSIRLAEVLAQNWGNMAAGITILSSEDDKSECIAYAWDMETNFRDEKRFTVKHWRDTKSGGYKIKDEREIYELAANMGARRKRACILAVIPGDVVEAAVNQCDVTLKAKMDITPEFIKSVLAAFAKLGVAQDQIEKRIQRRIDTLTPALAMQLKKIQTSLKDGMSEVADWFDPVEGDPAKGAAGLKEVATGKKTKKEDGGDAGTGSQEVIGGGISEDGAGTGNAPAVRGEQQVVDSKPAESHGSPTSNAPTPKPSSEIIEKIRSIKTLDALDEYISVFDGGKYSEAERQTIQKAYLNRKELLIEKPAAAGRKGVD